MKFEWFSRVIPYRISQTSMSCKNPSQPRVRKLMVPTDNHSSISCCCCESRRKKEIVMASPFHSVGRSDGRVGPSPLSPPRQKKSGPVGKKTRRGERKKERGKEQHSFFFLSRFTAAALRGKCVDCCRCELCWAAATAAARHLGGGKPVGKSSAYRREKSAQHTHKEELEPHTDTDRGEERTFFVSRSHGQTSEVQRNLFNADGGGRRLCRQVEIFKSK